MGGRGGGDQLRVNGVVMADHSNATLFLFGPSHSTIGALHPSPLRAMPPLSSKSCFPR